MSYYNIIFYSMKTLKARDCNQREGKTEVTQQQAAVTVLYLPKRKKKEKKLSECQDGF